VLTLVHAETYRLDWPGHVFPVGKYDRLRARLIEESLAAAADFLRPEPATDELLTLVHSPRYLARLEQMTRTPALGYHEFEIPISRSVLAAFRSMTGGTILAARRALPHGASVNLGGGFHHAFAERGEGFCLLNDVAVAIRALAREGLARRFAVIDCDLHQGNGTARIFHGDPDVFTFSIHQEDLYPIKEVSDLDIGLEAGATDADYLGALGRVLPAILDRHEPQLVFYVAGADPYEEDQLGNLRLTLDGLAQRDRLVFGAAAQRDLPVVAVLAGGYARRSADVVEIHLRMVREALARFGPIAR
jgi:acetoin utilization deacetylase AcuC-like enzyme